MLAKRWPCRPCGILLGICHLFIGIFLLIFDIATNDTSETVFGIIASILFIICALFAFISARRLDRTAQILLGTFATSAFLISLAMVVDSATVVNLKSDLLYVERKIMGDLTDAAVTYPFQTIPSITTSTTDPSYTFATDIDTNVYYIYSALLCIGLIELILSLVTMIICYRSLNDAYAIVTPESPYSILVVNTILKTLPRKQNFQLQY